MAVAASSQIRSRAYVCIIAELLGTLRPLRDNRYRPQWIVLEESQNFLGPSEGPVGKALKPMLARGGWAFVSYRPDRMDLSVLAALHHCFVARLREPESIQALRRVMDIPASEDLASTAVGSIWLCGRRLIRLRPAGRRIAHIRHLYKYLDIPLPRHKRFYFHTKAGYIGKNAASLFEFKELLAALPIESLSYHLGRGDFASWNGFQHVMPKYMRCDSSYLMKLNTCGLTSSSKS